MADPLDFFDEYDLTANLPEGFEEALASKKWTDRRDALQSVLDKIIENPRLAVKPSYDTFLSQMKNVLDKEANVNNLATAAKILTGVANSLKTKFAPYAAAIYPILFEKFKEKKLQLREPLCDCVDAFGKTINLETIVDDVVAAMGKPNPSIKVQLDNFIFRQLTRFTKTNHPKKFVKGVIALLLKHAEDSDKDVREAALLALGGIGRLTGDQILGTLIGPLSSDNIKMAKIKEGKEKSQAEYDANNVVPPSEPSSAPASASSSKEDTHVSTATSISVSSTSTAVEPDPWDFLEPCDVLSKLPENFGELITSKKWLERKEALESLLTLLIDNPRLDNKVSYHEIVETLTTILGKDFNINVTVVAAKCITQLAKGLRQKFAPHATTVSPVIFDKFKEKKVLLRDPLVNTIDAVYATSNLDVLCDDIAVALGKPNPNIKIQTNLFLYRVFKGLNAHSAPKKNVKTLTPLIAKCTGESDPEAREAAFSALGAIMKAIGKTNAMTLLSDVANDKAKMAQIEKFYNQAVQESGVEVVSEMVQSIHKSASEVSKPVPKVVTPPKPALVEINEEEEEPEEPLKPMAKTEEKPKRRLSSRPSTPVKQPEEPKSSEGVLSGNSNRNLRLKEEKSLKTLKWNFKTPDEEHITQLMNQFSAVAKPELTSLLFSKDFKQHIKALELIQKQLTTDPAVLNSYDLLLRWCTLRFFDTNPQSLNKTLEFVVDLLLALEKADLKMNETDISAFVPYLLLKIGDTKDVVRTLCRRATCQATIIASPGKILPYLIDALNTKNSRQKAECLVLIEHFLEVFGLSICPNPAQTLKPVAGCISERDSTARSNALNCIVAVWRKIGDRVFSIIGTLPAKEKAMLDERIKRMGREAAPVNEDIRLTPLSARSGNCSPPDDDTVDVVTPKMTARSRSTSRNAGRREVFNGNETITLSKDDMTDTTLTRRVIPTNVPLRTSFAIDAKFFEPLPTPPPRFVPRYVGGLKKFEIPSMIQTKTAASSSSSSLTRSSSGNTPATATMNVSNFSGDMMADCIDKNLSLMGSDAPREVISAAKELIYLFRDQANYTSYLISKAETIAKTIAVQFSIIRTIHLTDRASGEETMHLMRALCNLATFFIHQQPAVKLITHESLKLLLSELLRYLTDERSSLVDDAASISRSVNVITVKLCENAEINESFAACFSLLEEYLSLNAPAKLVELLLKCIFKRSENLIDPEGYCAIQPDRFLIVVDDIGLQYPKTNNSITERVGDSIRLVVQRLLGAKGCDLSAYLIVLNPQGELHFYLQQCIEKYKTLSKKTTVGKKRTINDIFALMQSSLNASCLSELYFHLKCYPEDQSEYESLLSTFPLKSSVLYYFDEFTMNLKNGTPKSFHKLHLDVLSEAGHTQALAAGPNQKHVPENQSYVKLPFSTPIQNSDNSKVMTSTPVSGSHKDPPAPKFTPINNKQMDFYKKRLGEIKASRR